MKRLVAVLALLATLAGCGRGGTQVRILDAESLPDELYGDQGRDPIEPRTLRVLVYLIRTNARGRLLSPPRLGAVVREMKTALEPVELAARLLLDGPMPEEFENGLRTSIQDGTELIGASLEDGVANINLSAEFETVTSEIGQLMRIAQFVWTLTDLPGVSAVRFRIHGAPQPVIDQDGVTREVVSRGRYTDLAPREGDGAATVTDSIGPDPT